MSHTMPPASTAGQHRRSTFQLHGRSPGSAHAPSWSAYGQALLLDLDGTLADTRDAVTRA